MIARVRELATETLDVARCLRALPQIVEAFRDQDRKILVAAQNADDAHGRIDDLDRDLSNLEARAGEFIDVAPHRAGRDGTPAS